MRMSKERVLTEGEFNRLLSVCDNSEYPYENKFLIYGMGRLGLRCGEIAHIKDTWVNSLSGIIGIPDHDPCSCNYCLDKYLKRKKVETASPSEVSKVQWQPKTKHGMRAIPYDFDPEIFDVVNHIMGKYGKNPISYAQIRHRIDYFSRSARIPDLSPHGLRATAATFFARDGITAGTLTEIMGWGDITVANHYVLMNGMDIRREIDRVYGKNKKVDFNKRIEYKLTDIGEKIILNQVTSHDMRRLKRFLEHYDVIPHKF